MLEHALESSARNDATNTLYVVLVHLDPGKGKCRTVVVRRKTRLSDSSVEDTPSTCVMPSSVLRTYRSSASERGSAS